MCTFNFLYQALVKFNLVLPGKRQDNVLHFICPIPFAQLNTALPAKLLSLQHILSPFPEINGFVLYKDQAASVFIVGQRNQLPMQLNHTYYLEACFGWDNFENRRDK